MNQFQLNNAFNNNNRMGRSESPYQLPTLNGKNHRDYLGALKQKSLKTFCFKAFFGAGERTRTADRLITN